MLPLELLELELELELDAPDELELDVPVLEAPELELELELEDEAVPEEPVLEDEAVTEDPAEEAEEEAVLPAGGVEPEQAPSTSSALMPPIARLPLPHLFSALMCAPSARRRGCPNQTRPGRETERHGQWDMEAVGGISV